jgi:hypothetical protein
MFPELSDRESRRILPTSGIARSGLKREQEQSAKATNRTADINVVEKSDCARLPVNQTNRGERSSTEIAEGRARTGENIDESGMRPTQGGKCMSLASDVVRQAA